MLWKAGEACKSRILGIIERTWTCEVHKLHRRRQDLCLAKMQCGQVEVVSASKPFQEQNRTRQNFIPQDFLLGGSII